MQVAGISFPTCTPSPSPSTFAPCQPLVRPDSPSPAHVAPLVYPTHSYVPSPIHAASLISLLTPPMLCCTSHAPFQIILHTPTHPSLSPSPSSSHLLACRPGTCIFLAASPLTLIVGIWQEIPIPNDCRIQLTKATGSSEIAITNQCSSTL